MVPPAVLGYIGDNKPRSVGAVIRLTGLGVTGLGMAGLILAVRITVVAAMPGPRGCALHRHKFFLIPHA
jgi:hypothetical protein